MDIVKRLREQADSWLSFGWDNDNIFDDAANEIERLRELLNADNQTLRLHFGELTVNEMRIVKAAFQWVLIRAELKENE